jgi:hypothetical protein
MSKPTSHPTPYPYVNEAVQLLLENVQAILKDNFVGLYLHGSLASSDFDPGHSNIEKTRKMARYTVEIMKANQR